MLIATTAACEDRGRKISQESGRRSPLSLEDQMLMFVVRLRLGRLGEELTFMLGVNVGPECIQEAKLVD